MANTKPTASKAVQDYEATPVMVTPYNGVEMKHTVDDAVRKLFTTDFAYKENTRHSDFRLILGYSACAFAAAGALYSYKVPFPDCRPLLAVCVVAYFILNSLMMFYTQYVEKDIIFVGTKSDRLGVDSPTTLTIRSQTPRFSPSYTLTFEIEQSPYPHAKTGKPSSSKGAKTLDLKRNFGDYFDVDGKFSAEALAEDVVRVVGRDGASFVKSQ
ncbi:Signal peptidase complex subunit 2 [Rhizophlyctis rosea]|uniref:Signal peptidase complex subunit 2 n=1 Tax=Rhizophlyctis rosea TaxID=64517 RepID=A0AAD5S644_9FUNG|nr:Signal peptidase complex subunit 2 [Rhizophlyctis rosea]